MKFIKHLLTGLLLALPIAAGAAEPLKIAVLSLVGDSLLIVSYRMGTGSNIGRNARDSLTLGDDALDISTAQALGRAVKAQRPEAETVLLKASDRSLHKLQDQILEGHADETRMKDALRPVLQGQGATHLLLVTRYRHDAQLKMRDGSTGSGKIEGLGFYIDRSRRFRNTNTGEAALGMIAPFSYIKASLLKADTLEVLREATAIESTVLGTTRSKDATDPWDALTPEQKVDALKFLVREASKVLVPKLLEGL